MLFDVDSVRERLPDRHIVWHPSIDSTMTAAGRLAREGWAHGTIVGAEEQTVGIGRHGHSWHSEAATGLYVSYVLRLPPHAGTSPAVMLALGLAAQEAIVQVAGVAADLRWPNDVLIGDRKCAGILAQLEGDAIIAGIGINVSQAAFPPELEPVATSLRLAGGPVASRPSMREDLLVALSEAVDGCCKILTERGAATIFRMFAHASSYVEGRRVRVEQDSTMIEDGIEGITCGLDDSGFLVVRQDNGKETTILAGGVRPA